MSRATITLMLALTASFSTAEAAGPAIVKQVGFGHNANPVVDSLPQIYMPYTPGQRVPLGWKCVTINVPVTETRTKTVCEEQVIQGFLALAGGLDGDAEVLADLLLADEASEAGRAQRPVIVLLVGLRLGVEDHRGRLAGACSDARAAPWPCEAARELYGLPHLTLRLAAAGPKQPKYVSLAVFPAMSLCPVSNELAFRWDLP